MLKPEIGPRVASTGQVHGAWWPRSRDLAAELPALAKALAAWLGRSPTQLLVASGVRIAAPRP